MIKILMVGEASWLSTGYSTISKELLGRLFNTGKYEIAELGCYVDPAQQDTLNQASALPWRFYFNQPSSANEEEFRAFNSKQNFAFGEWSFDKVCLDFQPDVVIDVRDFWMVEHQERSAFRAYFHWIWMPTVDARPQHPNWISTMKGADAIFTYSDWAKDELLKYKSINVVGSAPPGADLDVFKPVSDKVNHKKSLYLEADSFIIGTVMRNQKRKLYPELMASFASFLKEAPKNLADKSYLYLHTSYPDWWEIPDYLMEYGISRKTLFSYKCTKCMHVFVHRFQGSRTYCPRCIEFSAYIPNTHIGLDRKDLASIMNLFDVYVQYANSEGLGMPQVEAASCGVPIFAVDYSAMSDVVRKLKGYPIKVESLQREAETGCYRAIPSNKDLVEKLISYNSLPQDVKNKKQFETRKAAEKHYNWDTAAKIWESYLDTLEPNNLTWNSPAKIHQIPNMSEAYKIESNDLFVKWALIHILNRPDLVNSYMFLRLTRDLTNGLSGESIGDVFFNELSATGIHPKRRNFNRETAIKELSLMRENYNIWEIRRAEKNRQSKK